MKTVWFAGMAIVASSSALAQSALAQSAIYKHVDESGRVTYSNRPIKGAIVVDLEPLTTIPNMAGAGPSPNALVSLVPGVPLPAPAVAPLPKGITPARLVVTQKPASVEKAEMKPVALAAALATMEPPKPREDPRKRELLDEIARAERSLSTARTSLVQEQQNPLLIAAVRAAQQASDPSPSQALELRDNLEKASGRIRGLQATIVEQEKALESMKKELDDLKS